MAEWELWYQDNFDLECPRQLERAGRGLISGLIELWAHHLYETIQPNGFLGFDRFNIWWKQRKCGIDIVGEMAGQLKLRQWVYGEQRSGYSGCLDIADKDLLEVLAEAHSRLAMNGQTSEVIVDKAIQSNNKKAFLNQVKKLGMVT